MFSVNGNTRDTASQPTRPEQSVADRDITREKQSIATSASNDAKPRSVAGAVTTILIIANRRVARCLTCAEAVTAARRGQRHCRQPNLSGGHRYRNGYATSNSLLARRRSHANPARAKAL